MNVIARGLVTSKFCFYKIPRACCSVNGSGSTRVKIGNVTKYVNSPKRPEFVPVKFYRQECSQEVIGHLQWIMKKDLLGQDMFLIGLPGPLRRRIISQYAELIQQEIEYVVLSRDTTESDLKQRREIVAGTAFYKDQSAVLAAIEGRILVLDGVEKAERNVLPILNNLLENREIQLEDGRFLISSERYDKLLSEHSQEVLDSWKLVRVSENFRVITLGLPVPQFRGHPLDPPFRSRFQARDIQLTVEEQLQEFQRLCPNVTRQDRKKLLSLGYTFSSEESKALGIPTFPRENLQYIAELLNKLPAIPLSLAFEWLYPYKSFLHSDNKKYVEEHLKAANIRRKTILRKYHMDKNVPTDIVIDINNHRYVCTFERFKQSRMIDLDKFIANEYHDSVLSDMLMTHRCHDFCLIGGKGSGKTMLVKKFASILQQPYEMVMLYKDMTDRDLLQQRVTDANGDTIWQRSPLVTSALNGSLVVLDGLHQLHQSTLSVLHRLIHDRELQLFDGTRLIDDGRYEALKTQTGFTDSMMHKKNIYRIHPAFRIVALAEPPTLYSSKNQWLTPEVLSMFLFHTVEPLSLAEEKQIIESLIGPLSEKMEIVLNFAHHLRNSQDEALSSIGNSFSTRQLIRIASRLSVFPHQDIYMLLSQACLKQFLPRLTRKALEDAFETDGILPNQSIGDPSNKVCTTKGDQVFIGSTSTAVYQPGKSKVKVPDILFYDNPEHITVMESMLQDFVLGEHLLLVGNQGVGKNKIVDRFLQLLNRPREYIQLHRDTTVQSLTQQPSVVDGRITYEDSPLIKAVQNGHVLVVDEADKAPTYVTCILKALVESGQMVLSDGRSIVHHTDPKVKSRSKDVIAMHPDFRMIVLANRPGFPFLGNDFFATLGDIFSCHAVENPSLQSEISMLRQYGPNVPYHLLEKLVKLFSELRSMSDTGFIAYPYSTREVVNVVKHLEKFPNEGLPFVLRSVFDFDNYNKELKETLLPIFRKHGIPFGSLTGSISLAKSFDIPKAKFNFQWFVREENKIPPSSQPLKFSNSYTIPITKSTLDSIEARSDVFTEESKFWQLPISEDNVPVDICVTENDSCKIIHTATANPVSLMSLNTFDNSLVTVNLTNSFPSIRRGFKPKVKIAALGGSFKGSVLLFEKTTNQVLIINTSSECITEVCLTSVFAQAKEKLAKMFKSEGGQKLFEMHTGLASKNILFFTNLSNNITVIDLSRNKISNYVFPDIVKAISPIDEKHMFIEGSRKRFFLNISDHDEWKVSSLDGTFESPDSMTSIEAAAKFECKDDSVGEFFRSDLNSNIALVSSPCQYASVVIGNPAHGTYIDVYNFPRKSALKLPKNVSTIIPGSSQIVRVVHPDDIPPEIETRNLNDDVLYLEVTDINSLKVSYIHVDLPSNVSSLVRWLAESSNPYLLINPVENEGVVTVDARGCIRLWDTVRTTIEKSLEDWFKVTGLAQEKQLTVERENAPDASSPKHGKVDPTGAPHVGGNTWAGGTGGRDTAGLGGKGGPYRLDAGHTVFQLPDAEKDAVPPEIKQAAREMGMQAYKDKLKEIEMSEYDAEMYESIFVNVKNQVSFLRTILDSLQSKNKERQWLKHQTSGELDDTRLIEGITGEKNIYRKRGEEEPELGTPQEKPKKLRILVDVSGSMYRFNGHDNRLARQLESIILVMEAFDGYQDKFQYDIIGHSGEDFCIPFVEFQSPPRNNKERLNVLKKMYAHSQYCLSGDNTLKATKHAISDIANEEADEHFIIVMSDANFDRYGISPKAFSGLLLSDSRVNSFAVFIGTLGDQADRLYQQLPPGRGFMCLDTKQLPLILQQIFTSALLKE